MTTAFRVRGYLRVHSDTSTHRRKHDVSFTAESDGGALEDRGIHSRAGRTYSFYVTASDPSLNQSGRSNAVTVTTLRDTTPPTAPELTGSVRGPSQVSLTWTRSTDDTTWWTLGYRIFANGAPVTQHVNWYGERSVVLRHLAPDTSYTFTVGRTTSTATRR